MQTHMDAGTQFRSRIDRIRLISAASAVPAETQHRYTVKDLKRGGAVRLDGRDYVVVGVSQYIETDEKFKKEQGSPWFELKLVNLATGETLWIEWEEDDDVVISLTVQPLSFRVLTDDEGGIIDEDDLDEMAENGWGIRYNARAFEYADDYAARYQRDGIGRETKGDKVYFYEFSSDTETITVEEWKDGDSYSYEIFLSRTIHPSSLLVLALGDA